jgi:hypothetical protein
MIQKFCQITSVIIAALFLTGSAGQAWAQGERFEITSIKAVRPTLVNTIAALKAGDVARARAAFEAYDSAWNGIEEKGMIEIEKALTPDKPDVPQVTAMVNEVMRLYNEALAEIVKDARARQ